MKNNARGFCAESSVTERFASTLAARSVHVCLVSLIVFAALQLAAANRAAAQTLSGAARLSTYDTATGETYFALSLTPSVRADEDRDIDVVIVFDTSASQTGLYRADGIEALQTMLANMGGNTRVKLMAGDLEAVALNDDLAAPDSPEIRRALEKLQQRAPLGSTDMNAVLRGAMKCFDQREVPSRCIVYMGDGISRANILEPLEFQKLIKDLVRAQISVSSYAIGPDRDVHLLAAISNHTGGMVYLDAAATSVSQLAGAAMARVAQSTVVWPMTSQPPKAIRESYPNIMPPLRQDRDSVLIGVLSAREAMTINVSAVANGQPVELQWEVEPEPSSDEWGYLPPLVEEARKTGGLTLATIGSTGLREAGRMILASAENLAEIGSRAMQTGDVDGAKRMAEAVLRRDPTNPQAQAILRAIQKRQGDRTDDESLIIKSPKSGAEKRRP